MAKAISYRIMPRWLRNTDNCVAASYCKENINQVEFAWVMFEILDSNIKTATPICWLPDYLMTHPIGPASISIADSHEPIDVLKMQLPAAIL